MTKASSATHIVWITPERTPYHDFFFEDLARKVYRLDVIVTGRAVHPWKNVARPAYNLTTCSNLSQFWHALFSYSINLFDKPLFVISGWNRVHYIITILLFSLGRQPFLFWTDTPNIYRSRGILLKVIRSFITLAIFRFARRTMSTGTPGRDVLIAMGCPAEQALVFPFFVPIPDRRAPKVLRGKIIFFSAGRLDNSLKGFDIGLRAYAKASSLAGAQAMEYRIAGDGIDRDKLFDLSCQLGISSQVTFVGWLNAQEMREELNRATAFVHPARCDPFPVVILEAMASGVVVLGSDVCGSVMDRVTHGKNGMIHTAGDVDELSRQMAKLTQNTRLTEEMGLEAYRTACSWPVSIGTTIISREWMAVYSPIGNSEL